MFVLLPGRSRAEAFRIGEEIAREVTAANPPPVMLKMEKVGRRAGLGRAGVGGALGQGRLAARPCHVVVRRRELSTQADDCRPPRLTPCPAAGVRPLRAAEQEAVRGLRLRVAQPGAQLLCVPLARLAGPCTPLPGTHHLHRSSSRGQCPPAPLSTLHCPLQATPTFDAKGIETVRRDGCPAVVKMMEGVLRLLFATKDLSQVGTCAAWCAAAQGGVGGRWRVRWWVLTGCGSGVGRLQQSNRCAAAISWSTSAAAAHPWRPEPLPAPPSQPVQVKEYCERQFSKILAGRVSVADFVFAKEVGQGAGGWTWGQGGRADACLVCCLLGATALHGAQHSARLGFPSRQQ